MTVIKQKIGGVWTPILVGEQGPPGPTGPPGPSGSTVYVHQHLADEVVEPTTVRAGVRAAITAAGVNGTLIFDPRDYVLEGPGVYAALLAPLAGQTWIGNGARITSTTSYIGVQLVKVDEVDDVTISGFTFTCQTVTDAVGIQISRCDGVDIHHNRFINPRSGGVHGKGDVTNLRVADNLFRGGLYGILMTDPAVTEVGGSFNWAISGNTCDGLNEQASGITLNRPLVPARGITVSGNTCRDYLTVPPTGRGYGIAVANCGDVTVTGNFATNCGISGIHIEDAEGQFVTITGNTVRDCGMSGIFIQQDMVFGSPDYITVTGNTVRGCCTAPVVNLGKGGIEVNYYTGGSGDPPRQMIVANNISYGNTAGHGIYMHQAHFSVVHGNVCNNSNGGVGIFLEDCKFVSIMGNIATDDRPTGKQQTHGLKMITSATASHVEGNIFNGNLTGHMDVTTTDHTLINSPAGLQLNIGAAANELSFFEGAGEPKQTVTGSRGANAALTSLLTALANYGLITNSSSA